MATEKEHIAVAKGDGIGPEIMEAVLRIFEAAGVPLEYHYVDMGLSVFEKGYSSGMTDDAKAKIEELGVLLKGPMETPKGKGVKSINVTARKLWNTFGNVRKFRTLPGVETVFSKAGIPIILTVMRENLEDTYGGIEYLPDYDMALGLRLISRPGSEQFIRLCFETAKQEGLTKVTCAHKSNIMKITDGLFMNTFYKVAEEYPEIEVEDVIVDAICMKLVRNPEQFQMIVSTNLQGDILSDLCAGLVGGLGFAPGANIGDRISIFEAVHGTAPDIAGKGIANPTSLLLSGLYMLRYLGLAQYSDRIENALYYTLEQGVHTGDFGTNAQPSSSTAEFAGHIIGNLGKEPEHEPVHTATTAKKMHSRPEKPKEHRFLKTENPPGDIITGIDISGKSTQQPQQIAEAVQEILPEKYELVIISNRGTVVWPQGSLFTDLVPYFRVRVACKQGEEATEQELLGIAAAVGNVLEIGNIFFLKEYEGERGYSLAQGQ